MPDDQNANSKPIQITNEVKTCLILVEMLATVVFLILIANASSQRSESYGGKTRSLPLVDALISRLQREQWKAGDGACLRATLDMLQGVNNNTLWATWVWDSMQLPVGSLYGTQAHMGNYDQCLLAPWSTDQRHPGLRSQYCLVKVKGPKTEQIKTYGPFDNTYDYYRTPTKDGRHFNLHYFGACLPYICSPSSVARISQHLLQLTHLPDGDVIVDPRNCETAGEEPEYPTGYYVFWITVGILFATAIISTVYSNDGAKQNTFSKITRSFCMKRNYHSLFTVSRDEVKVMHGMRFLTAVVIASTHEALVTIVFPSVNALDINKVLTSPIGLVMSHAEIAVDTFFTMSGLLLIRGLMTGRQKNVAKTLVKRYIRLIGPFALCVLFYATACEYITNGPAWREFIRSETEFCAKHWWKSLLMANTDVATICPSVTWYISCDFQLAILAAFLFWLFRMNRKLGITAFLAVAVTLTVNLGLFVYWNQLDILPCNFKSISLKRDNSKVNGTYFSSQGRAGPYLVGMVMGYIIATYKPAQHRHVIGKYRSIIIAIVSLLVGSIALSVGAIFSSRPYDPIEAAVVVATNRTIWGISICAIIGVCEYGSLTLIPKILSWQGFVPLSKLTYCIYLLHIIVIHLAKYSARSVGTYSMYYVILNTCGVTVVTCGASLVLHLILEAPLINVANTLFSEKSKHPEQDDTKREITQNGNGEVKEELLQNGNKVKIS